MRYTVQRTSPLTWEVESEEADTHYVRFDIFKEKFICDCIFDSIVEGNCKHKLYAKQNLVHGIVEFDDGFKAEDKGQVC